MEKRKLYDVSAPNRSTGMINGESSNILNWDDVRYPWAFNRYKQMLANFWSPFEVGMGDDIQQWDDLTPLQRETFKKIIGLLAMLDSIQTDFAGKMSDYITDSSVNAMMIVLAQQEVVHNHSYSYVLSALVQRQEQQEVFEYWKTDSVLRERNDFIAAGYIDFAENPTPESMIKSIVNDVILEGLFFYVSFAFFYDLARQNVMMKTAKMINFINRDEHVHVALFVDIFKEVLRENPELNTPELEDYVYETFKRAVELEIQWGEYTIGNNFDGINSEDLAEYIQFTANKRIKQLGFQKKLYPEARNTLKWIKFYEDMDETKTDYFENKNSQYAKVNEEDNGFDDL